MSWSQALLVGVIVSLLVQGNESTGCAYSIGTSRVGIEPLQLNCYPWGISVEVGTISLSYFITSLSYICTNSTGILVQNGSLLEPGYSAHYILNSTYLNQTSFPPETTCTLLGCYVNDRSDNVYDLENATCTIPGMESTTVTQLPEGTLPPPPITEGYGSTLMSEVPEGYLPTSAESVEYLSTTTWRSGSQDVMMLTSQTLATMETATLPLSTPPPTLQTTVATSIPTDSVLPTLGLQDNLHGAVSDGGRIAVIVLLVAVAAVVILTSIVTVCIMILRYKYNRSSNAHKIYGKDFLGDIDLTFKPVEVQPSHKLKRGESLHSIHYTLEKEPKVPLQTIPQEPISDDSDEKSEILSTCAPTAEDVSCRSMLTEDPKYPNNERQDISVGTKQAHIFSTSSYVCEKYTSAHASESTSSDHTFDLQQMSGSSTSENFHFLEQVPVLTSPTSMPCQQPVAQNDGYVQDAAIRHAILGSTNQNQPPQLNTRSTSTAQPNGYMCDTRVLQQNSSYPQNLTTDTPFLHVHNQSPTETTAAVQEDGYYSDRVASPQYSSTASNPKCESDVLLFCTEYDETFTSVPSTTQLKAAVKNTQPIEHCSDGYTTEDHVPHHDTNNQGGYQEVKQLAFPHMHNPGTPFQANNRAGEYIQHPLSSQPGFSQTKNNHEDFIWCFDSADMSEDASEMTEPSPGPRTGSQMVCYDPQSTREYVQQNDVGTGSQINDGSNVGNFNHPSLEASGKQIKSDTPSPTLSPLAVSEKQLDGDIPIPLANGVKWTSTEVPLPFTTSSDGNIEASTGAYISHTPVDMDTFQAGNECYQEEGLPWLDGSMLEGDLQANHQNPMLNCSHSTTTEHQVEPEMSASTGVNLDYLAQGAAQSTGYMDYPMFSSQPELCLASRSPDEEEYVVRSADYTCVKEEVSSSQHEASHYHPAINIANQQALMSQHQTTTTPQAKCITPSVLPSLLPSLLSATSHRNTPSGSTMDSSKDESACLLWLEDEDDASLQQRTPNLPFIQCTNVHHTSSYTGVEEMKAPVYPIPSFLFRTQPSLPSEKRETRECQQYPTIKQQSIELDIPEMLQDFIVEGDPISNIQEAASLSSGYYSNSTTSSDYVDGATMFEEELQPINPWKANCYTSDYM